MAKKTAFPHAELANAIVQGLLANRWEEVTSRDLQKELVRWIAANFPTLDPMPESVQREWRRMREDGEIVTETIDTGDRYDKWKIIAVKSGVELLPWSYFLELNQGV